MNQPKKIAVSVFAFAALLISSMARAQQDEPYHQIGRHPHRTPPPIHASGYHKACLPTPLPPLCPDGTPDCGDPPQPHPYQPGPIEERGMQKALSETMQALGSGASGEATSESASKTFDALGAFLKSGIRGKNGRKGFITHVDCTDYCQKQDTNTTSCTQSCTITNNGKSCQTTCS